MLVLTPLTIDATPISYNSIFTDREGNNSLKSTFIKQENLNGTRNFTQQYNQAPSHFINEKIVETRPTTVQQSISTIHPTLSTPKKHGISTNNYTIDSETFSFAKIITDGL